MPSHIRLVNMSLLIATMVLGGLILYCTAAKHGTDKHAADRERPVPVAVKPIRTMSFTERVTVQGNIESREKVLVPARVPGTIDSIFVDEGDAVIGGKTRLFQIDPLKLKKAVEVQRRALAVARCALLEKQTRMEQVQADLKKARTDYRRFEKLLSENAVSQDAFEQAALRFKQAEVARKHLRTLIDLAGEQKHQAEAALAIAEKDLQDSLVFAPIDGRVVLRLKEPGEMAGPGEPVLKIEDPRSIEAVAFLPAQYYGRIRAEETRVNLLVYDLKVAASTVDYKGPTIHEKLRTFVIKSRVDNPPDKVIPGAMVEMDVILSQRTGLGVPTTAIRTRNNGPVIFIAQNGSARMVPVAAEIEENGQTLVTANEALDNALVVVQGQILLDDGKAVAIQRQEDS